MVLKNDGQRKSEGRRSVTRKPSLAHNQRLRQYWKLYEQLAVRLLP